MERAAQFSGRRARRAAPVYNSVVTGARASDLHRPADHFKWRASDSRRCDADFGGGACGGAKRSSGPLCEDSPPMPSSRCSPDGRPQPHEFVEYESLGMTRVRVDGLRGSDRSARTWHRPALLPDDRADVRRKPVSRPSAPCTICSTSLIRGSSHKQSWRIAQAFFRHPPSARITWSAFRVSHGAF